jgi:phospholipase/carboxylesterase
MTLDHFHYQLHDKGQPRTLFLLHGTGGDENDLVPLAEEVTDAYNLVGLRGNINENGMPRFFARTAPGVFDQASLRQESDKLATFLESWYAEYNLAPRNAAFVGYSNGANMLLATLLLRPMLVRRAALLHAMWPFEAEEGPALDDLDVLLTYGDKDQLIPIAESQRVARLLQSRGARVEVVSHYGGHELGQPEIDALRDFLQPEN